MVIETAGIILSLASVGFDIYDHSKKEDLLKKINKAYNRARKQWGWGSYIRESIASRFYNFSDLVDYIGKNGNLMVSDPEYASFLKEWEKELKSDTQTYLFILETLQQQGIKISEEILVEQKRTRNLISNLKVFIGRNFDELKSMIRKSKDIEPNFKFANYQKSDDYIKRSVREYNRTNSWELALSSRSYEHRYLIEYLIQENPDKHIILYSEAQVGKSTELKNLAYEAQYSGIFNVILFDFKNYVGGSLTEDTHLEFLATDNAKRNLLILDGLDEVKDEWRQSVINQIEHIVSLNPDLHLIVSCRSNYENTNYVEGFKKTYLNSLSYSDVEEYIKIKCIDSDALLAAIRDKQLGDIIYNPFYLKSIIKYYSEKGELPETKSKIYDYVIDESFVLDQRRNRGKAITIKEEAMPLLQKIAFCLQLTGEPLFNYAQLTNGLALSKEEIESCCKYTIFRKGIENSYNFTHNAFREYLTARHISGISFDKLKEIICYPQTEILRPNLYNTVLLLVSILGQNNPLLISLIEWLAKNNSEVLFMCEQHFLSDDRCNEIFKTYFENLKTDGEYIWTHKCEQIMSFSNSRDTILYLLEECSKETTLTNNLSNGLSLLQYADFNLLKSDEREALDKYAFQLITQYKDDKDRVNLIYDLFENSHFQTNLMIKELQLAIKDCENPMLLNQFFRTLHRTGLSDEYIDWVISKKECIKNYETSSGATMMVSKDALIDVLTSVKNIENIIKVLKIFKFNSNFHIDRDKRSEIIDKLFVNLESSSEEFSYVHLNELLEILCSEHIIYPYQGDNTDVVVNAYRKFIFGRSLDKTVFDQYYDTLKNEMISPQYSDADHNDFIWRCMNVISTLMTEERFERIMNDERLLEERRLNIIFRLGAYEIISNNSDCNDRIETLKEKHLGPRLSYAKMAQDGFDILLDHSRFNSEVRAIADKYKTLSYDWDQRHKLQTDGVNESILSFIWDNRDRDDRKRPIIIMADVIQISEDLKSFDKFIFSRLVHYLQYKIIITREQSEKIDTIVCDWVNDIDNCMNIHSLAQLIIGYNVKLDDKQLLLLVPHSYCAVKKDVFSLPYNRSIENSLLEHIASNISNKQLVNDAIASIIDDNQGDPPLYYTITDYIVKNQIHSLYSYFEKMFSAEFDKNWGWGHYSDWRLNIADRILQLGQEGLKLVDIHKDSFCINDRVAFYRMVMRDEKLKPNKSKIITDLHQMHNEASEHIKEIIMSLLLSLGDVEGLKIFLDHYKNKPDSFMYEQPSFVSYDYDQVEIIKGIYEISSIFDLRERSHIRDASFNWLNSMAVKNQTSRDHIISYYKQLSKTNPGKYFHLLRISKNLYNKFYEENSSAISISDAAKLYIDIC